MGALHPKDNKRQDKTRHKKRYSMALPLCMDGALHARIHYIADGAAPRVGPREQLRSRGYDDGYRARDYLYGVYCHPSEAVASVLSRVYQASDEQANGAAPGGPADPLAMVSCMGGTFRNFSLAHRDVVYELDGAAAGRAVLAQPIGNFVDRPDIDNVPVKILQSTFPD